MKFDTSIKINIYLLFKNYLIFIKINDIILIFKYFL